MINIYLNSKVSLIREKSWLRPLLFLVMLIALVVFALFFYHRELEMERDYIRTVMRNTASVRGRRDQNNVWDIAAALASPWSLNREVNLFCSLLFVTARWTALLLPTIRSRFEARVIAV